MTCEPESIQFQSNRAVGMLVLVDMRKDYLAGGDGLLRSPTAGIIANCRLALTTARQRGWRVVYVYGEGGGAGTRPADGWLKGFEPHRMDAICTRRGRSCYSSPYFSGVIDSEGGAAVYAGFLGDGGCLATAADAIRARHGITFLEDAIKDHEAAGLFGVRAVQLLRSFTAVDIEALSSAAWSERIMRSTERLERNGSRGK
jgi:nicotinamidase-related amidase